MPRDPYEVLSVNRDASDEEIKKVYRKLARDFHPDRNPGDKQAEERFKEVQDAYDVLSDKKKRAQFDRFGFAGPQGGPQNAPGGGFHWGFPGGGGDGGGVHMDPAEAEAIFGQFFGGDLGDVLGRKGRTGRPRRPAPAEPIQTEITIPFLTAARGGQISVGVNDKEIDVRIPPGIAEGKTLRLQGQGPRGADLHLKIRIEPHAYFEREGKDIVLEAPITVAEAILGAKIDVPTLEEGKLSVKVPPGASSGARLRLRGKGIDGGDQYVKIKIVVPLSPDEKSRELIEEFARRNPQNPRQGPPWE